MVTNALVKENLLLVVNYFRHRVPNKVPNFLPFLLIILKNITKIGKKTFQVNTQWHRTSAESGRE